MTTWKTYPIHLTAIITLGILNIVVSYDSISNLRTLSITYTIGLWLMGVLTFHPKVKIIWDKR